MKLLFTSLILLLSNIAFSQTHTISGKITDAATGESLLFADCYDAISQKGTTTNAYGHYSLSIATKNIVLTASYIGYHSFAKKMTITKDSIVNIQLLPNIEQLEAVTINKSIPVHKQTLMGKISIPASTIKALPSFLGETDLMKSLSFLPGVASGKDGYSNIFIRGGDRGQNLILLDGIKLYNTNHVGGLLSIFNTDIIKQVDLYKGGFPARYGGRASGVLDITTKEGNNQALKGKASIGLLTSSVFLESPIKDDVSFYFAARSSYFELFSLKRKIKYKRTGRGDYTGYTIFDINSKINWKKSDNTSFSLTYYTGHDYQISSEAYSNPHRTELRRTEKLKVNNTGLALNHYAAFHPKWFIKNTLAYSQYANTQSTKREQLDYNSFLSNATKINEFSWQSKLEYQANETNSIKAGVESSFYKLKPSEQKFEVTLHNQSSNTTNLKIEDSQAIETAIYIEDEIKMTKKTRLNIGLRGTAFYPKDTSFYRLEPRVSFRWLINPSFSYKMNYTHMNQYNHNLVSNYDGLETEIWLTASKYLPPQKTNQFAMGFFYAHPNRQWKFSLESYYKEMGNLLEYQNQFDDINNDDTNIEENIIKNGIGEAYGIETQISKNKGKISGSLSYTLAWSYRQFDALNNGKKYPSLYNRKHNIALITNFKLSKSYNLTTNFNLSSGRPVTLPEAYVSDDEFSYGYFISNSINNRRLPLYHRLDLSLKRTKFTKKENKRQINLNIYNVYARQNAVDLFYDRNTGKIYQTALFSILPTLNYSYEF